MNKFGDSPNVEDLIVHYSKTSKHGKNLDLDVSLLPYYNIIYQLI
jgi:hypothetical protein